MLCGWLDVHREKRSSAYLQLFGFLFKVFVLVALFGVMFGIWGSVVLFIAIVVLAWVKKIFSVQFEPLFSLTSAGRQKLFQIGPNSTMLVLVLRTVAFARPVKAGHCTNERWRKHLSGYYADNATFHTNFLLLALEKQGLIASRNGLAPQRTPAGDAALTKAETEIELGFELPRLLREGSPQAVVLANQLGSLLMLVPGMEGYFQTLINMDGFPNTDKQMDWDSKADFLDGDMGSGIGVMSGCGVGSDNSDGDWVEEGRSGGCGGSPI